jgi:ABC-type Fe3+ transport system substrate-binding protein
LSVRTEEREEKEMSEFEAAGTSRTLMAIVVIVIIVGASAVTFIFIGGLPGPTDTTTTTTGTTTGTDTTTTTPTGPQTLTILTRHDVAIHNVYEPRFLASDFAVQNQITDLVWRTPDFEFWDDLIDTNQADVCWGGGPTSFDQLMRDGRLAPLTSPLMQAADARVNDTIAGADMRREDGSGDLVWIAAAISSFGFTVNHAFLTANSLPVPNNWTDLAKPIYGSLLPTKSSIAMGHAPGTTSNTRIYEIMTQGLGWYEGWATMARMIGNADIYGGSVDTQQAVQSSSPTAGVAMSIDFYGYGSQAANPDCEYIIPEDQTIVNGDPIAIAATSSKKALSEGFVDFVLTSYGQSLWLDDSILRMPVMREAFDEPGAAGKEDLYSVFNQTTKTVGIDFNDTLSLEINAAFVQYWGSVFTDAEAELDSCWEQILWSYDQGYIDDAGLEYWSGQMGAPVSIVDPDSSLVEEFTIDYARRINNDIIYDSSYRADCKTAWTNQAKAQYIAVEGLVPTS